MTIEEFALLVRAMRKYQITSSRDGGAVHRELAVLLEREVDRAAGEILVPAGQAHLFAVPPEEGGAA